MKNGFTVSAKKTSRGACAREKAACAALFTGAVLLPSGALLLESATRLCAKFSGFVPLATPWHTAMVSFSCVSLLSLWLAVCRDARIPVKWYRMVALGAGMALVFCALFSFLSMNYILAVMPLRTLGVMLLISLIPPVILIHTPLLALASGVALSCRFSRVARQRGTPVSQSLSLGVAAGLAAAFAFFAGGVDTGMAEDVLPKPSWRRDSRQIDVLREEAEQGDRWASFRVAMRYAAGHGADRDVGQAVGWYAKALWQGCG
ncbi:MAG: hypothetical protein FWG50_07420, partial [Kiritimatiellaeota bacterium]|nr:hypothetical protein [Kiritimatiellota bacterium]